MLEITNLRHGAVVGRHSGRESAAGLELIVEGVAGAPGPVLVNGVKATSDGRRFSSVVELKEQFNDIRVETKNGYGAFSQAIKLVWDKNSFKRYNFFIDDHSFFFTEIAKSRPKSLFDHFYLKFLREMNRRYGMKVTLNCFYRNDHHSFQLSDFPDAYRQEWRDNADWLRLAFHAYSEFPDRPYQNVAPEKTLADFDLLREEIIRIAGEECWIPPVVLHWFMARPDAFDGLVKRGVRMLNGEFLDNAVSPPVCDLGYCRSLDDAVYLERKRMLYDFNHHLLFTKIDAICNLLRPCEIPAKLESALKRDVISLMSHEQYSYPGYSNYQPDHHERIETALRLVTEHGYKPVFFAEGFSGNKSWEE
jgi:hypothetical protein